MALTCPRCSQNLAQQKEQGVDVDACPDCKGMWLDAGEIEDIVQDKEVLSKVFSGELVNSQLSALSCPKCRQTKMTMLRGGLINPMLLVDQCPNCKGLWLDGGELRVLQKVLATVQQNPSSP